MNLILYFSELMIPMLVFFIIGYGLLNHITVYDSFVRGAGEGIKTVARLVPTLIGLMVATGVMRASGFLDFLADGLGRAAIHTAFPVSLVPLAVLRMFSSSAATGLLLDIYKQYGTDSFLGLTASLMMSSTETIFYTMSVYFMTANIKKTRHTLCGALIATFAGIAASVVLAGWIA